VNKKDVWTERFPTLRITERGRSETEDIVVKELSATIVLNEQEVVTLLCSPSKLEYLAIGFLFSEGLLEGKGKIKEVVADDSKGMVKVVAETGGRPLGKIHLSRLITSGGGRGPNPRFTANVAREAKVGSGVKISVGEIASLVTGFVQRSHVFKTTGGVHSAALCDTKGVLVFSEDIGRHNAIDKIFGECILEDIPMDDRIIVTSGRVSSEILLKIARGNIPILISKSAPTNLGVRLAADLGVTLVGFVRGNRMNVYTGRWRIKA